MSSKASDYTWQLKVGSTPRKLLLTRMAKMAEGERHSYYFKVDLISTYLEIPRNKVSSYLADLQSMGLVSVLERTYVDGGQKESRVFIHGPWDCFGGTGTPFAEIEPHLKDKNFKAADTVEITPEVLAELRTTFNEYAEEDGVFRDGNPRSRWRLGSRAHSLVCWYGLGNTVIHNDRPARVTAITNTGPRNKVIPVQVNLTYIDEASGDVKGVLPQDLKQPEPTVEPPVQDQPTPQNPSSEGGIPNGQGGDDQMVRGVMTKQSGHGMTKQSAHESSSNAKRKSSSEAAESEGHGPEEEEESPSAPGGIEGAAAIVASRTDATDEEARALVAKFLDAALARGKEIGQPDVYVSRFKDGDLGYHLSLLRRQRAPQGRTEATEADSRCSEHHEPLDCVVCENLNPGHGRLLLRRYGPVRRPDLARRYGPTRAHA